MNANFINEAGWDRWVRVCRLGIVLLVLGGAVL
jgi:hypothetical protein